ncbi:MAG: PhzF family phenazine biosynthesis protein [Candidatus Cloacimonetes bacterium]|nr:PhzF family phenazine biosynthesis protein [Candidatus Cloacimonadota bacterium]
MQVWYVITFNENLFCGNPAAVVLMNLSMPSAWCQSMALELYQAITVFLLPICTNHYKVEFYTSYTQVALCGHGTLSCGHVLYSKGYVSKHQAISFHASDSILGAMLVDGKVCNDFPELPYSIDVTN